jgi:hypothetical protein
MPCEHYKDALMEAAASGAAPQDELRAHLVECSSCRAAFAEEQTLFAAIDSGLHAAANAEITPSFLLRIRSSIDGAALSSRSWFANGLLWAGAAVAVVAVFAARGVMHRNAESQSPSTLASNASSPSSVHSAQPSLGVVPLLKGAVAQLPHVSALRNRVRPAVANPSVPEVLVTPDQEVLLAQYAQQWQRHRSAALVAEDADWTKLTPLQPSPILINPLDVKLLKEVESQ